jgi:hypothetical protein
MDKYCEHCYLRDAKPCMECSTCNPGHRNFRPAPVSPPTNAAFIAHSRDDIPYLLSRLEKTEAENRWIPVGERLPENGIDVLLYWSNDAQNKKYVDIERYHIDHWETLDRPWIRAIAWMPLPEPPKGE